MATKNMIPHHVWDEQAVLFELGLKHANQIARDLGVSPQTVSREMKRRGAVKDSRVNETIKELTATLDRKARCVALMKLSDSQRRRKVAEANMEAVGRMVTALLANDIKGDLTLAAPVIDRMGKAVGMRRKRQSRS